MTCSHFEVTLSYGDRPVKVSLLWKRNVLSEVRQEVHLSFPCKEIAFQRNTTFGDCTIEVSLLMQRPVFVSSSTRTMKFTTDVSKLRNVSLRRCPPRDGERGSYMDV